MADYTISNELDQCYYCHQHNDDNSHYGSIKAPIMVTTVIVKPPAMPGSASGNNT